MVALRIIFEGFPTLRLPNPFLALRVRGRNINQRCLTFLFAAPLYVSKSFGGCYLLKSLLLFGSPFDF